MKWFCLLFIVMLMFSCQNDKMAEPLLFPALMEIPEHFPDVEFPEGAEFTLDRWKLGKKLFYDEVMSIDSSISCASCHKQELGFSDDIAFSLGVEDRLGTRNAHTLANVAYHPYFTREGGVPSLEMQIFVPIQEHNEFAFDIVLLAERLATDSVYIEMAQKAYDRTPDPYSIVYSLACFERSLISGNSAYDKYLNNTDNHGMNESALRGMDLFFSEKTNCSQCHNGFDLSNYAFENNGLYVEYEDEGRLRLTGLESDRALFKVPSLRNIVLTAPYMHNGSIATLDDVIEHYTSGVQNHPNKNPIVQTIELSDIEKDDLIQFLESLTDHTFINNPFFRE
jgi:cytochrome c peroxidase